MPTPTPAVTSVALAQFRTVTAGEPIDVTVHFNPASLQYTVSNTLKEQGSGSKKKQYVSQTSAKLTMDLVFDTTPSGEDVRETTDKMAKLLKPHGPSGKQVPPVVEFSWGLYRFTGMVEQYRETLDFFGSSGVPLRSSVNLTLASQDVVFDSARNPAASVDGTLTPEPVSVPTSAAPPDSPAGVASALGDPRAARAIASANGSASLRFSAGASLAIGAGAGVSLAPAAAFSVGGGLGLGMSGGIGIGGGIGAGVGIGAGAGFGLSAGGGVSVGAGAGVGASAGAGFGAGASLGASASAGLDFSGLRAPSVSTGTTMPGAGAALALTADAKAGSGAQFALGGRAQSTASTSLSADVGSQAELTARLKFGGS
ncbi:MAG: hypothetical protein AB7N65_09805 [Vicinamibacterales bacterium]